MKFDRSNYINEPLPIKFELKFFFKKMDPITIFDIGACEGEDSIKYSKLFPNSFIYSFEPLPQNQDIIEKNFKTYNVFNAKLLKFALSDTDGFTNFHVSSFNESSNLTNSTDWDFGNKSSSLLKPEKHTEEVEFIKFDKLIEVETVKLDTFCKNESIQSIDIIHMDVQGAELMVLNGAKSKLKNVKLIWLEVSDVEYYKGQPLENDIRSFMNANNFFLVKNTLKKNQGDHLYLSRRDISKVKLLLIKYIFKLMDYVNRIFKRLEYFFNV